MTDARHPLKLKSVATCLRNTARIEKYLNKVYKSKPTLSIEKTMTGWLPPI